MGTLNCTHSLTHSLLNSISFYRCSAFFQFASRGHVGAFLSIQYTTVKGLRRNELSCYHLVPFLVKLDLSISFSIYHARTHSVLTGIFFQVNLGWSVLWELRMMEVVVTTGGGHIITTNQPAPSFLQAGCPSCRPTNSVKALKGKYHIPQTCLSQAHLGSSNFVSDH